MCGKIQSSNNIRVCNKLFVQIVITCVCMSYYQTETLVRFRIKHDVSHISPGRYLPIRAMYTIPVIPSKRPWKSKRKVCVCDVREINEFKNIIDDNIIVLFVSLLCREHMSPGGPELLFK